MITTTAIFIRGVAQTITVPVTLECLGDLVSLHLSLISNIKTNYEIQRNNFKAVKGEKNAGTQVLFWDKILDQLFHNEIRSLD